MHSECNQVDEPSVTLYLIIKKCNMLSIKRNFWGLALMPKAFAKYNQVDYCIIVLSCFVFDVQVMSFEFTVMS